MRSLKVAWTFHTGDADQEFARQQGTPYGMARRFLRAPGGWPCTPPPWGTLGDSVIAFTLGP